MQLSDACACLCARVRARARARTRACMRVNVWLGVSVFSSWGGSGMGPLTLPLMGRGAVLGPAGPQGRQAGPGEADYRIYKEKRK